MPVIVSVLVFIIYYIIDNTGYKMARDGKWIVWMGMWTSSAVLAPLGIFLTYKSNKDSVVLNADAYINWFKKVLGIRSVRHLFKKEVIINDPDYARLTGDLERSQQSASVCCQKRFEKAPNYFKLWMSMRRMMCIKQLSGHSRFCSYTSVPYLLAEFGCRDYFSCRAILLFPYLGIPYPVGERHGTDNKKQ